LRIKAAVAPCQKLKYLALKTNSATTCQIWGVRCVVKGDDGEVNHEGTKTGQDDFRNDNIGVAEVLGRNDDSANASTQSNWLR
jgi:hypothetical protein